MAGPVAPRAAHGDGRRMILVLVIVVSPWLTLCLGSRSTQSYGSGQDPITGRSQDFVRLRSSVASDGSRFETDEPFAGDTDGQKQTSEHKAQNRWSKFVQILQNLIATQNKIPDQSGRDSGANVPDREHEQRSVLQQGSLSGWQHWKDGSGDHSAPSQDRTTPTRGEDPVVNPVQFVAQLDTIETIPSSERVDQLPTKQPGGSCQKLMLENLLSDLGKLQTSQDTEADSSGSDWIKLDHIRLDWINLFSKAFQGAQSEEAKEVNDQHKETQFSKVWHRKNVNRNSDIFFQSKKRSNEQNPNEGSIYLTAERASDFDIPLKHFNTLNVEGSSQGQGAATVDVVGSNQLEGQPPLDSMSVQSLIQKTVKKMEGIMNKRVEQYSHQTDLASLDSGQDSPDHTSGLPDNTETIDSGRVESGHRNDKDNSWSRQTFTESTGQESTDQESTGQEVTAAVLRAVESRTVPRDRQFWRDVYTYLDSSDYLSRTRRSSERGRKRNGAHYVHLSITYGHVMPCQYKDRFYCMNGGTCVFVGALDIKTCRCPIGYTGVRCELIDQEYILSLLTNTLIFS